jgi:ABC-type multidrug transport system ATPase subunit
VYQEVSHRLWQLIDVSVKTAGRDRLQSVNVRIDSGVTAIMGSSGAGKTSLLNLLVGYESPTSGRVETYVETGPHALPVFWVPQDGGLWPHLSVLEHLEAVRPSGTGKEQLHRLLDGFEIADKEKAMPEDISMGQRARLSVARALAADMAVLVMDEPLAHVDETRRTRYWEAIRKYAQEKGISIVFATHSPRTVLMLAEQVICLTEGRAIYSGSVEDLYHNPETVEQAECLGEANWLEGEEASFWLSGTSNGRACYRPEQVRAEPAGEAGFVVESNRSLGPVSETRVVHSESRRSRRIFHRPVPGGLRVGQHVWFKALLALILAALIGCSPSSEKSLTYQALRHWPVPPDGPRVPAPRSVAIGADDEVFVLDDAGRVLLFESDGKFVRSWRMPATDRGRPEGICVLADGRVAVCDTHYHQVIIFDREGNIELKFGREGRGEGQFIYPVGIVQDDEGFLYVCEYGSNDRVQKFTTKGEPLLSFGGFGIKPGMFQRPSGMAWRDGTLYVADAMNNRIEMFTGNGDYLGTLEGEVGPVRLHFPYDVAIAGDGTFYVVEYGAGRVTCIRPDGSLKGRLGRTGHGEVEFATPWGMAVDSLGRLRVADTGNRRVVEVEL